MKDRKFVIACRIGIFFLITLILVVPRFMPIQVDDQFHPDQEADLEKRFAGQPASAVLKHFGVRYDQLRMSDEPPGKLQGISFLGPQSKSIYVQLRYSEELFSTERTWF